ncbi:hypothetical protein J009_01840 [Cryptococcus neoformans]|nr:hypothetical protein J009_01840 [Cryptococcus neoformans var. grubii]OXH46131.1 hypothetical protein J002_06067 [Cryptococcus neoformans var. grubii]OXH64560.1 hypothetical protein J001_06064 [Cryptococcus neoformans var. grubii]
MLAPPQRPKRLRSPSPSLEPEISDLASPLDILLKRRKKEQHQHFGLPDSPHSGVASPLNTYDQDYFNYYQNTQTESNSTAQIRTGLEMGVERRRTKQWDRINAPPNGVNQHQQQYHYPPGHLATPVTHPAQAAPSSAGYPFPTPLPAPHASNAAPLMSSSPIRNQPPSSSPFREKAENMQEEHWIDEEEMRREWGEAYTEQNSLLHNLHLARLNATIRPPSSPRSHSHPSRAYRSPNPSSSTMFSPARTSTSPYIQRTPYPQSSPYTPARPPPPHHTHSYTSYDGMNEKMGDDEDMNDETEAEIEVRKRYEEANRLLGELAVVRRQRWGEAEV